MTGSAGSRFGASWRIGQQSVVATTALVLAQFRATRDWSCSRMRRFDRRILATADTMRRHPVRDVAGQTVTDSCPPAETDERRETSACYASHPTDARIVS